MAITKTEMNKMIKKAFDLYDADKSGFLEKQEIRILMNDAMGELGKPPVSDKNLDKLIDAVDENNDGKFDFGEFYMIIAPVLQKALF